ncbi:ABC transporter ATP-binding protein [Alkalibacillus haloalkaliphilus]|uniref:ABC transporter ATP-binding protein n=1 Tax=Alkalibacillus haloalkaliphilus TaxID=94136 RepID=UPI0002EAA46D|nr:ABC transporter ATP-binding protein [Alkalibacillus haloalkaliphilus]
MNTILNVQNLTKQIDDFDLGPISFDLEPNTITVIVGNNGAGKSTLLKSILNFVKPNDGDIRLLNQGHEDLTVDVQQEIAYQPQQLIGCDPFTGDQLQQLFSKSYHNWDEDNFQHIIKSFDIPLHKSFSKLSKGMQQKLNFALNIAKNAKLMILDEPTAGMDIPSKQKVIDILNDWVEQDGRTILLTTHQVDEVKKLADYIMIMKDGSLLAHEEKDTLTNQFKLYWLQETATKENIPGEVSRNGNQLISDTPIETEACLQREQIHWVTSEHLDLEEVISLMLTR